MNYELSLGVRQSRRAFRYIFARIISPHSQIPPNPIPAPESHCPQTLAKDAAPIPNAAGVEN